MDGRWLLVFLILVPALAQGGLDRCDQWNRASWMLWGCLVAVVCAIPNPWAAACVGMLAYGMLPVIPRSDVWARSGLPALGAAGAYAVLTPKVTGAWIEPGLWAMSAVGVYAGCWTEYSRQRGLVAYHVTWPKGGWWLRWSAPIAWHEDSATHLKAGQGNANHLQSVAALAAASVGALALLGRPWALLAWPLVLAPMLRRVTKEHWLGQGHVHLATGLVAALGIWSGRGWILVVLLTGYILIGLCWLRPWIPRTDGLDGGRFGMWRTVLAAWWSCPWRQRLLGLGTGTWQAWTTPLTMAKHSGVIFTAAHNEGIQWVVEHGLIGGVCLGGYAVELAVRCWTSGSGGQALLLVVLVMGSIAMTNFPWTWFHQIHRPNECSACGKPCVALPGQPRHPAECPCPIPQAQEVQPYYVGSPALNAMSLALAILCEAF